MRSILLGVCVLLVATNFRESGTETINYQSYVMTIKLYLNREEIPELIVKAIFGNDEVLSRHFKASKISLNDMIEVVGSSDVKVKSVWEELDIEFDHIYQPLSSINWDRRFLEDLLTFVSIKSASEAYSRLQHNIFVNGKTALERLSVGLNINSSDFYKAIMEENPKKVIEILSNSNYTKSNIKNQLNIFNPNLSLSHALKFLKSVKFNGLMTKLSNNVKTHHLVDIFKQMFTKRDPRKLVEVLKVRAQDFLNNEAFASFLKHVTNFNYKVIGTAISDNKIATFLYDDFLKYHTRLVAESFHHPSIQYDINEIVYERPNIATLITKQNLMKYVAPAKVLNTGDLKRCTYVTKTPENGLHQEMYASELNSNKALYINKTNGEAFALGSPLICGDFLYGVSNWEDEECIEFVPVCEDEGVSSGFLSMLFKLLNLLIFALFAF